MKPLSIGSRRPAEDGSNTVGRGLQESECRLVRHEYPRYSKRLRKTESSSPRVAYKLIKTRAAELTGLVNPRRWLLGELIDRDGLKSDLRK